ncbi:MAG: winged helix-turn-helix domain-containing protein [Thermoprotei archaeon]|nr:winged helix-turn-helix domain-containing protein [Thermoprotei archaeon]
MKRRSRIAIIMDILSYIESEGGEALATRTAQATGLAYDRLIELLEELEKKGIIEMIADEKSRRVILTRKGRALLSKLRDVEGFLRDLGIQL